MGNICFRLGGEDIYYDISRFARGKDPFDQIDEMESGEIDGNIYFCAEAPSLEPAEVLVELRKRGYEKKGAYAAPLFVDWENGDFRLRPDSPALKMGVKSIDLRDVGLTENSPEGFK